MKRNFSLFRVNEDKIVPITSFLSYVRIYLQYYSFIPPLGLPNARLKCSFSARNRMKCSAISLKG